MIPQTLGALVGFLALAAPGVTFELSRERRRARRTESAFREAARVALASFGFSAVSCTILGVLWLAAPGTAVDLPAWVVRGGSYFGTNLPRILGNSLFEVVVACALALLAALLTARWRRETASVSHATAWEDALRNERPDDGKVWLHVQLKSGRAFLGYLGWYTVGEKPADREVLLEGLTLKQGMFDDQGKVLAEKRIGTQWEKVLIAATEISYIRVAYTDAAGNPAQSHRREHERTSTEEPPPRQGPTATRAAN
ncbi:DUF6338 family protein [Amycolatopsis sp. NPDC088138]|uniref:DUF6338 family protein n=1 Tax=Amycolatopsis sp. NPDC088138 TaxID=3363938 RepID=UPI003815BFEC